MNYRAQLSVITTIAVLVILTYFSWPPVITGFAGFTAGIEANLTIWDETDNESFEYANQTRYPGDIVFFFANYTNATDGTILNNTIANCSINFSTSPAMYDMWFNETKLLWEFNATFFSSNPEYNFSVNCSALGTDYDNLTAADNFTISDNITPSLTVDSPVNGTVYGTALIDLNFIASDDYAIDTCWYTDVNGSNNTLSSCANTTFTANEGENNITVYANDTSNNINSTQIFFIVDTTPPSITITSPQNASVFYTDNISLEFTVFDANLDSCWYELSDSSIYDLPGCANTTIVLPQGKWWLRVWANDSASNTNSTPNIDFTIWTQFVTVCSFGCNFTNINDALAYVNGTVNSVIVNESGNYALNDSYYVTGEVTQTGISQWFGEIEAPCTIILSEGPVNLSCNNNWLIGAGAGAAICSNASQTTVEECNIRDFEAGIFFNSVSGGIIRRNELRNMSTAIGLRNSTNIDIYNNSIANVTGGLGIGVGFDTSVNIYFANNSCTDGGMIEMIGQSPGYGDIDNLTFTNNVLSNCSFKAFSAEYLRFSNNTVRNTSTAFLFTDITPWVFTNLLGNVSKINVINNFIENADVGIYYSGVSEGVVANNNVRSINYSFVLDVSQDILIENNTFIGGYGGILINSTP